jgi:hypothetical protein
MNKNRIAAAAGPVRLVCATLPIVVLAFELLWIGISWNSLPEVLAGRCSPRGGRMSMFYDKHQFGVLIGLLSMFIVGFSIRIGKEGAKGFFLLLILSFAGLSFGGSEK